MKFEWEYVGEFDAYGNRRYHVWKRNHRDGYAAYQVTHTKTEPMEGKTGHYVEKEGLERKLHIKLP